MAVERGRVELREHVNALEARVQAVADGDVDEAIFATQRHCGFGAVFGQWIKTRPLTPTQYDANDGFHTNLLVLWDGVSYQYRALCEMCKGGKGSK